MVFQLCEDIAGRHYFSQQCPRSLHQCQLQCFPASAKNTSCMLFLHQCQLPCFGKASSSSSIGISCHASRAQTAFSLHQCKLHNALQRWLACSCSVMSVAKLQASSSSITIYRNASTTTHQHARSFKFGCNAQTSSSTISCHAPRAQQHARSINVSCSAPTSAPSSVSMLRGRDCMLAPALLAGPVAMHEGCNGMHAPLRSVAMI